jgi:hypothetical protein
VGIYLSADPLNKEGIGFATRWPHVGNEFAHLPGCMLRPRLQGIQFFGQCLQTSPLQQFTAKASLQDKLLSRLGDSVVQFARNVTTFVL